MRIYLDGIGHFHDLLSQGKVNRANAFALSLTLMVKATVTQLGRTLMHLASLNPDRCKTALRDFAGVLVQIIALPCLGICATVSPKEASGWIGDIIEALDMPRVGPAAWIPTVGTASDVFARVIGGLFALPVATTRVLSDALIRALCKEKLHADELLGQLKEGCLHTFSLGMYAGCREGEGDLFSIYDISFPARAS